MEVKYRLDNVEGDCIIEESEKKSLNPYSIMGGVARQDSLHRSKKASRQYPESWATNIEVEADLTHSRINKKM